MNYIKISIIYFKFEHDIELKMKVIQLNQEEKQLIMLAVENNRQAQQQIYAKFSSKMLSICRQYIKDIHHAET